MGSDLGDTESWSRISMVEIGRVDAKPMCVQASVCPETPGRQSAGQTAPVLPDALAECAPPRACSPRTVSEWTKVGPVHHARKDECEHRRDRRPKVGSQPCRSRQCSPTPLPSVRGHGHAAPAPFLNGQMSVSSTPCQYVCKHRCDRRQRSAISLRRTAFALRHSRRLCAATGTRRHQVVLGTAPYQSSRLRLRC